MKANTSSVRWCMWAGALAICLAWPISTYATPNIIFTVVGTTLTPNSKTNTVQIYVQDPSNATADKYNGLNFAVQIADGGVNANKFNNDTTQTGPLISNLAQGTALTNGVNPFTTNNPAYFDSHNTVIANGESQIWTYSGTTAGGLRSLPTAATHNAASLLMTLTIDTTGMQQGGTYALTVQGTYTQSDTQFLNGTTVVETAANTDFSPAATLSLTVSPEPASLGLLGVLIPGMLLRRRRAS